MCQYLSKDQKAQKGQFVKVHYTGKLDNGDVFDSSEGKDGEPLVFQVGMGMVVPGFDNAVLGMELNEEKNVHLDVKDAYGERQEDLVKEVPRKHFKADGLKEGMNIVLSTGDGHQFPAHVVKISKDTITLDMNHPLAGKALNFHLKLIEISDTAPEGFGACDCGCSHCGDDDCGGNCDDESHHHH